MSSRFDHAEDPDRDPFPSDMRDDVSDEIRAIIVAAVKAAVDAAVDAAFQRILTAAHASESVVTAANGAISTAEIALENAFKPMNSSFIQRLTAACAPLCMGEQHKPATTSPPPPATATSS